MKRMHEPVGEVTRTKQEDGSILLTDEAGYAVVWPRVRPTQPLPLDPRIDLTKPIFAQAQKLQAQDKAAAVKRARKRASSAA